MTGIVKFKGAEIPIKFGYKEAWSDFPAMGVDVLSIFDDGHSIMNILGSERVMVEMFYYFAKAHVSTLENMLESLTPEIMQEFREVFWNEVVNFTNPQMRPALQEMYKAAKSRLSSPELLLEAALSASLPEQESTQPSTPLEKSSS